MFRKFFEDRRGNFTIATAVSIVPILGAVALAIDFSEMTRQRALALNALDAAGIAAARYYVAGGTPDDTIAYAKDFFEANMNGIDTSNANFNLTLPSSDSGGGLLTIDASYAFKPYFFDTFASLLSVQPLALEISAETKVRLKNTLEVALVLDNSGSMDFTGSGSGKKRMELLKTAAKQLVDTLAGQAAQIKQVEKPVQFSLVPFAASVNVGPSNASASWMDTDGRSPVHHENFDWSTMPSGKQVTLSGGVYYKVGTGWGAAAGQKVTRFSLFDDMQRVTGQVWNSNMQYVCTSYRNNGTCRTYGWVDNGSYSPTYGSYASWQGCVEVRPHPYNLDDTTPTSATPATLFVPMFAPDETDLTSNGSAPNSYWADISTSSSSSTRQKYMPKYFEPNNTSAAASGAGPNSSCTTKPITPLTDVTTAAGKTAMNTAIDAMQSNGATNVPEGIAWGWRTLSHAAPFSEGRPESEKGNDKVVIVLTDGANTYYTPSSLGYSDAAGNKSTYSAYGYTGVNQSGQTKSRIFMGTSVSSSTYSNSNYTNAMTQQMNAICEKAKSNGLVVMTVALDLSSSKSDELGQINALKSCASESKFRKGADGNAARLFWNTTGGELEQTFKEIADELSNLRIVS
ncbi:MAG: pilus assembly protein TadG-related protein [Mesorhizobium sp.]